MWKTQCQWKSDLTWHFLQQILVPSRVTNLDHHDKIFTWDLTYLHTDSQMFRVCQEEALVAVKKKWDENETNLETYKSTQVKKDVNCEHYAMVCWVQILKKYLFTYRSGFFIPTLEIIQMPRLRWAICNSNSVELLEVN